MLPVAVSSALIAPTITILQESRVRRHIAASDSVAALVAELAFGPGRRDDNVLLVAMTTARIAACAGARS